MDNLCQSFFPRQDGLALFWYGKILIEQQRHQEATDLVGPIEVQLLPCNMTLSGCFTLQLSIVVFHLIQGHLVWPFSQHQAVVYLKASIDYHEPTRMAAHAILGVWETQLVGWDSLFFGRGAACLWVVDGWWLRERLYIYMPLPSFANERSVGAYHPTRLRAGCSNKSIEAFKQKKKDMQWVQDVFPPKRRQRLLQNKTITYMVVSNVFIFTPGGRRPI